MENLLEKTVGQMVADDYRAATVFEKYGIDFCCRGNRTISEVCEKNNIDEQQLIKELEESTLTKSADNNDYKSWPLDLLADYIEKKHHRYVEERIPVLIQYLNKITHVHGQNHPELEDIANHFQASAGDLAAHMKKEEFILFPYVRKMIKIKSSGEELDVPGFQTVNNPVAVMMNEHDNEGERFRTISRLSNNYTPPEDACNTYRVAFSLLQEFEEDLHKHIHLENNILFPRAIEMEKELMAQKA